MAHAAWCRYFHEPPTLRDERDCDCGEYRPLGGQSPTAKQLAYQLSGLAIGFFGSANPKEGDQEELASDLVKFCIRWINDKYELGLRYD